MGMAPRFLRLSLVMYHDRGLAPLRVSWGTVAASLLGER